MGQIKAVLFDVIGTTVLEDDPELINKCFQAAFYDNEVNASREEILRVRGMDKLEAITEILTTIGSPTTLASKVFNDFKLKVGAEISKFREHPDLEAVIAFLKSRDILVGVGSGLPSSLFEILYKHLHWERHNLDYAQVFEKFKAGRPDPVMIHDMCKRCRIQAHQLLKVGDTVADILEGKNAGAHTAVILVGTQGEEILIACEPDHLLKSLKEVMTVL